MLTRSFSSQDQGADEYILDLRENPGGLVRAGLDIADMWLDGALVPQTIVRTVNRAGQTSPIETNGGRALTEDPLVVLVNGNSASASEILAGALRDNARAQLVGQKTFGKGRIQVGSVTSQPGFVGKSWWARLKMCSSKVWNRL
jgi:carboxyl-terminal processing protease